MKNKLLLIDGSSILSTSFYATLDRNFYSAKTQDEKELYYKNLLKTSTGIYTNAVYTTLKILLNIIKNQKPSHLVVAWDVSRNTFRREMYSDYKGQRGETPAPLKQQFGTMQKILKELGVAQFFSEKYEADDYIGSISKKFENDLPVIIYTKDQDALQLVSDNTRLWLKTSKNKDMYSDIKIDISKFNIPSDVFEFTPLWVKHFYGVRPDQITDYKALLGDDSDNIPGVKGVGLKSVIPLLQEYDNIENIYDLVDSLDSKKDEDELKKFFKESLDIKRSPLKNLKEGKELAFLSKKLATIKTDIDNIQSVTLDELKLNISKNTKNKVCEEYEMNSLINI